MSRGAQKKRFLRREGKKTLFSLFESVFLGRASGGQSRKEFNSEIAVRR